jgi:murein DD-endopeptidase MepM/ murein hydrolase activator NlpD
MKLILREQQIQKLLGNKTPVGKVLNVINPSEKNNKPNPFEGADVEIPKIAPHLANLGKLLYSTQSTDGSDIISTDNVDQFATYIPKGDEMVHPLGHKDPITSEFGFRSSTVGTSNHKGIDISAKSGSPVYAPLDGIVIRSEDTTPNRCGGHIRLDHTNIETKFCHLRQMVVKKGDKVKKGQLIGYSGGGKNDPMHGTATGPHLHYEILNKSGIAMNPITVQHNLAEQVNDKQKEKLNNFVKFVKKELGIKHPPTVAVLNEKGELKTTANYDYGKENKVIKINGRNRMMVDIMRSIAHEMTHHKQWEDGKLKVRPPDIGGPIEDEANAKAGQLIKMFAKIDSTIYDE